MMAHYLKLSPREKKIIKTLGDGAVFVSSALNLFQLRETAIREFMELNECESEETFEITESQRKSPQYIRRIIMTELKGREPGSLKEMPKPERDAFIRRFVFENGISKSALERATGISRGVIIRVVNK